MYINIEGNFHHNQNRTVYKQKFEEGWAFECFWNNMYLAKKVKSQLSNGPHFWEFENFQLYENTTPYPLT